MMVVAMNERTGGVPDRTLRERLIDLIRRILGPPAVADLCRSTRA